MNAWADDDDAFQSSVGTAQPAQLLPSHPVPSEEWLEAMRVWLSDVERVSDTNLKSTMRVCTRLANGEGVDHPAAVRSFRKSQPVTIEEDMDDLVWAGAQFLPREED
eukprot:4744343-Prymnesium_polylepis.1